MVLDISCQQFGGIYLGGLYMLIMDISCQHLGDDCNLEGFFVPYGHTVGECTFLKIAILLDICCQQFGAYVSVEYICSYLIYHANTYWKNISWRISVCPAGTELGSVFLKIIICIGYRLPTIWGVCGS